MVRPTPINMNPVDLIYLPFMISLNKCTGSCNVLSPEICVPEETKDTYVEKMDVNKTCQYECKNYCKCKKDYSWNPSTCI